MLAVFIMSACSTVPETSQTSYVASVQPTAVSSIRETQVAIAPIESFTQIPDLQLNTLIPIPSPEPDLASIDCLAKTIYFEARNESLKGWIAVGYVVTNRMKDPRFPNTACGVVHQTSKTQVKNSARSCQFHWYCDGLPDTIKDTKTYEKILVVARQVLEEAVVNPIGNSLFFHAVYVKSQKKQYLSRHRIGNHIFYT